MSAAHVIGAGMRWLVKDLPDDLLDKIVDRLARGLKPERIYLFGSHAYGKPGSDSDVDLFVVVSDSELPRHQREAQALGHLIGLACPIDVLVYTRAEVDKWSDVGISLPHKVLTKGKLLYAA